MILRFLLSILLYLIQCIYCVSTYTSNRQSAQSVLQPKTSTLGNTTHQQLSLKSIYHHSSHNSKTPGLFRRLDLSDTDRLSLYQQESLLMKPTLGTAYQPTQQQIDELFEQRRSGKLMRWSDMSLYNEYTQLSPVPYPIPDVKDHPTVLTFAQMTYNAYLEIGKENGWHDMGEKWKVNSSFGWDSDGLRGHVFGNVDDSLLIISYKGTSAGLFSSEPTGEKDKLNDNMLFSCCCGKASARWTAICDCNDKLTEYHCDSRCVDKKLLSKELYYDYAASIYMDTADRYPNATIWLVGHSLGGALASLIGQTFGVPAVSFESPGESLASRRLHLPWASRPNNMPIWHFGHTADPIFIGACTGPTSSCYFGGYAMETRCHTNNVCVWDTVKDNGWRVNINTHRLATVIDDILKKPNQFPLPECKPEIDCVDCGLWSFTDERDLQSLSNTRMNKCD
ncbi:Alpha/Beta hydrolase protein [Pilobolus umbonatus]|nr:Alpha/Beta hydrolase protein [Pilobolus umbonatus]